MKPRIGTGFLVLVGGFWFIEELAPVILISFGDFVILLFALIHKGTFGGFDWGRFISELWNPPLPNIGAFAWEPVQVLKDAQEVFWDMRMSVHWVL